MENLVYDVIHPLRKVILDAIQSNSNDVEQILKRLLTPLDGPHGALPVYAGVLPGIGDRQFAILLTQTDSETNWHTCIATDYVAMMVYGPADPTGRYYGDVAELTDAASSLMRATERKWVNDKFIYSIGTGSMRSRLDTIAKRSYLDVELTVLSNLQRREST